MLYATAKTTKQGASKLNSDAPPQNDSICSLPAARHRLASSPLWDCCHCVYTVTWALSARSKSLVCRNSAPLSADILSAWRKALFGGQKWTKPLRQSLKSFKRFSAPKSACIQRSAAALWLRLRWDDARVNLWSIPSCKIWQKAIRAMISCSLLDNIWY